MTQTIDAIYENGVFRPLAVLPGLAEKARVQITVESKDFSPGGLAACRGILPDEDAAEMLAIIEREFEQVNPNEW